MSDHFSHALQLLAAGQLDEARIYLEEVIRQDPDNPDLYNLGHFYVDLGQPDRVIDLLHRCLQIAPQHSHACVARGIAYLKLGDLPHAKEYSTQALAADARNPVALKNLGAIFGQEGTACGLSTTCAAPTGRPRARSPPRGPEAAQAEVLLQSRLSASSGRFSVRSVKI